jgi:glutaredoxin 3
MATKRKIEVFSAGCATCEEAVATVRRLACLSCEVIVLDIHDATVAQRAQTLGIRSLPAVAVDGRLAACCSGRGVDAHALRTAGVGAA